MPSEAGGHLQGARCLDGKAPANRHTVLLRDLFHKWNSRSVPTMRGFRSVQPGRKGHIFLFSPRGQRLQSAVSRAAIKNPICQTAQCNNGPGRRGKGESSATSLSQSSKHKPRCPWEAGVYQPAGPRQGTLVSRVNDSSMAKLIQPAGSRDLLRGLGCFAWHRLRGVGKKTPGIVHRAQDRQWLCPVNFQWE